MNAKGRARLERATALALEWHADQKRKGTDVPYASHLFQVAGLVLEHGGTIDQAIAGLLHDSLEDAPTPKERHSREKEIAAKFGAPVLRIVLDCTDTQADEAQDKKRPWRERKERHLAHLKKAPRKSLLVAACDKRHNLGAMVGDVRAEGPSALERFKGKPEAQLWFFGSVLEVTRSHIPPRLAEELDGLHRELREQVRAGRAAPRASARTRT